MTRTALKRLAVAKTVYASGAGVFALALALPAGALADTSLLKVDFQKLVSRADLHYSEPVWIRGLPPVVTGNPSGRPDGNTMPIWFFDLCTLESDAETLMFGHATFNAYARPGTASRQRVGVLSKVPLVAAIMGRSEAVRSLLPSQIHGGESPVLANRMDLREGPQTTSAQRLGNAADALHTALCYDLPAGPGQPPVIRVFGAWPKDWEAEYRLLCRGGFLVSSAMHRGQVEFVEIQAQHGGECRLRNPWGESKVDLYRDGRKVGNASGSLLKSVTGRDESIVLVQTGKRPHQFNRTVLIGGTVPLNPAPPPEAKPPGAIEPGN